MNLDYTRSFKMWRFISYTLGLLIGTVTLLGGSYFLYSMPELFAKKIQANLPLINGTDAYTRYTNSTVPLNVKMYVFNVTNPEEVIKGAKPKLNEVGPFSFTERRKKNVIGISNDNTTLDYRLIRTYFFNETNSVPLSSIITLPNVPAFSAVFAANLKKDEEEGLINPVEAIKTYLTNETIYTTALAESWLFKGIKLEWLDAINGDGVFFPDQPPDNTFGFYYKKNGTWDEKSDGTMTVSTGADGNFTNIGKVLKWNGKPTLNFWKSTCNNLKGTDGQFFHPNIKKGEELDIFAPDLCRSLAIKYQRTVSLRSIELYRFGIASSFFEPIDSSEKTSCYCMKKGTAKQRFCKLRGITDASSCRNKPIVLSTPHFFNGDPQLLSGVDGLNPSAVDHDTFIDVEPMTGAVMRVRRRLQLNVEMTPVEVLSDSLNIKKSGIIHPFVWLDQSITIPDHLAEAFENKLTKKVRLVRIGCYTAVIVGPLILIATLIFICVGIKSEDKKIRSSKSGGADYRKVQVVMKTINPKQDTK